VFVGVHGRGAFQRLLDGGEERPVTVSPIEDPRRACFCESVEAAHSAQDDSARVAALLGITAPPFRIDSQCKYAAVARGDAPIYLRLPTRRDYVERIWDHAAGHAVVTEAGGRVTDVAGRALDFSRGRGLSENTGVVVTNGRLHDAVLGAVREVLGG
jgi:3'(2'), 5'-bisphosphate nucleotidase